MVLKLKKVFYKNNLFLLNFFVEGFKKEKYNLFLRTVHHMIPHRLKKKNKTLNLSMLKKLNFSYLNYFSNIVQKKGMKLKALKTLKEAFKNFFDLFLFCEDKSFFQKYEYFTILKSYSFSWSSFFNINKFLHLLLPFYNCIFIYKYVKVNKKLKKKIKQKFILQPSFLKKEHRLFFTLKTIYLLTDSFKRFLFTERFLLSLLDTFFLLKNSYLYKQKVSFYKNIMKERVFLMETLN